MSPRYRLRSPAVAAWSVSWRTVSWRTVGRRRYGAKRVMSRVR